MKKLKPLVIQMLLTLGIGSIVYGQAYPPQLKQYTRSRGAASNYASNAYTWKITITDSGVYWADKVPQDGLGVTEMVLPKMIKQGGYMIYIQALPDAEYLQGWSMEPSDTLFPDKLKGWQFIDTPEAYPRMLQSSYFPKNYILKEEILDWTAYDTAGNVKLPFPTERKWSYSHWGCEGASMPALGDTSRIGGKVTFRQYRICSITGIRQYRQRIEWTERTKSDDPYEYIFDGFKKNRP